MLFKVGDKVRFLNEKGGGIITKVISPTLVHVAVEDGFEIPTLANELVKVEETEFSQKFFRQDFQVTQAAVPEEQEETREEIERITPLLNIAGKKTLPRGIYIAFVPHSQKWLITGHLDIYIVNHTEYEVLYSYMLRDPDGTINGMDYDVIPTSSKVYLQTIDREEIEDWNKGILQLLFHKASGKKVLLPASCSFDVKDSRFIREDHYTATSIIQGKALLVTIVDLSRHPSIGKSDLEPKYGHPEAAEASGKSYREPLLIDKHRTGTGEAEVDLHIEELVNDLKGLDPEHILSIQLDYFSRCLESAISSNYHSVVFIHGIGNGSLKTEIKRILDDYQGLEHRPAPMAKYGSGAITVTIFHNR